MTRLLAFAGALRARYALPVSPHPSLEPLMRLARPLAVVALFAAAASAQTSAPTSAPAAATVDNPPYVAWAKCPPGSSIDATMTGNRGGAPMTLTMTSTLQSVAPEKATISTTVTMQGLPPQTQPTDVPAKVEEAALYNPQKIPGLTRTVVGKEDVTIAGKAYACTILEMAGTVQDMPVKIRVWETMDVPGGFAKLHATIGPSQMNVDVQKVNVKS